MTHQILSNAFTHDDFIEELRLPIAYGHTVNEPVVLHETHISWVLLAGRFAYKIKKPIVNDFVDYGTLAKRHHACCEELRLGNRYVSGMYLDIVPVTFEDGHIRMDGDAQPIEFAVQMRRFPEDALLSQRLKTGAVNSQHMVQLASTIAGVHQTASKMPPNRSDIVFKILDQAKQNIALLRSEPMFQDDLMVRQLEAWTDSHFASHESCFHQRLEDGFIRECHGDLHCDNVVYWDGHWVPFDGIEFNSDFSWIDVLSDIGFLIMDLQDRGHEDLSAVLLNAYLEQTGDYCGLSVLKWYTVYRALVRAKVAVIRARQVNQAKYLDEKQAITAREYISLAHQMIQFGKKRLWITHGVSGSGKTTGSQQIIEKEGAIRIRSDIERKRIYKTSTSKQPVNEIGQGMYSRTASEATYSKLHDLAKATLRADFPVVVDATFLKQSDRNSFQALAISEKADFRIVCFHHDEATLTQRIDHRRSTQHDASEATVDVLKNQLFSQEPLTAEELTMSIDGTDCFGIGLSKSE